MQPFFELITEQSSPPDHHAYTASEVEAIRGLARRVVHSASEQTLMRDTEHSPTLQLENMVHSISDLARDYRTAVLQHQRSSSILILTESDVKTVLFGRNPEICVKSVLGNIISTKAPLIAHIPPLPDGYGYKGGAARAVLETLLAIPQATRRPRDLDVVRFGDAPHARDRTVARKFMREDFAHGNSVEITPNLEHYMKTRDLTLNEVLWIDDTLYFSFQALQDTINATLRHTPFLRSDDGLIAGKITMKALRFAAENHIAGRPLQLAADEFNSSVTPYDIALHLERALARGTRIAEMFLLLCIEQGYLSLEYDNAGSIGDAAVELKRRLPQSLHHFPRLASCLRTKASPHKRPCRSKARRPVLL